MAEIAPQNFARPIDPGVTPVNFGSPGGHGSVMSPFDPPWANLLPRAQTPGDMISAAQFAEQMRTKTRADQGRNALAQIFANPDNLDANGLPKPEALAGLAAQGFPKETVEMIGAQADMAKSQADIARSQMTTRAAGQELYQSQLRDATEKLAEALIPEYEKNVKEFGEQRANEIYLSHRRELVDDMKKGGTHPAIADKLQYGTPPETLRANAMGMKDYQARQDKQSEFTEEVDSGKTPPVKYRRYKDGHTTDISGKAAYTPTGVGESKAAELQRFKGKDAAGKEIIYHYAATGAVDDKGDPVDTSALKGIVKVGTKEEQGDAAALDDKTLQTMASQYLAGDRSVMQNIGRGAQGSKNIVALRAEIAKQAAEKGISGPDIAAKMAEYDGMKAGMRTLGTRTANVEMAVTEAQQLAPLAVEASGRVNRTQFPLLNQVLQAGEKGTGDEDVVRFGIAVNSLINTYARAINPTGVSRVSDIEHARELLSTAWSKGQINAGIDQLMKEMEAARKSPGAVRQEMSGAISGQGQLPGGAPAPSAPAESAPAAAAPIPPAPHSGDSALTPDASGLYNLKPGEDWKSLPPDAHFRLPDDPPGKMRIRP